ncbi:MAG TPA: DUF3592 domain-containing protein [Bacteroidales bacterium]|jgi:hypothetical protein|nr:DUF3592 domain-containing protein [Bacteroidales bacterium]
MNKGTIILLVMCLLAILAGIVVYFEASAFQKKARIAEGIVTDTRMSSYHVIFTPDNEAEQNLYISARTHGHHDGDKVRVFYNPDNPAKARITDGKRGGKKIIFWAFVVLVFDLYMMYLNRKNNRITSNFKTNGRKVLAEITGVETDYNTTIRKVHPYTINCKWSDPITGKTYNDSIKYIWKDPAPLLSGRTGIDVYIDRQDPGKYMIDKEFLGDVSLR